MAISIAVESPLQDEVRELVAELNEVLLSLSPPEACYHLTVEQMAEPGVTVFGSDGVGIDEDEVRRPQQDSLVKASGVVVEERKGAVHAPVEGAGEVAVAREAVEDRLRRHVVSLRGGRGRA